MSKAGFASTASRIDALNQESMNELLKCVEDKTPITNPNLKALMNTLSSAGKDRVEERMQQSASVKSSICVESVNMCIAVNIMLPVSSKK